MGYGKTSSDAINQDAERLAGGTYFKVPQGGTMVYLCPPWTENGTRPYHEVKVHYRVTDGPVLCRKVLNDACPVCEANTELYNRKDDVHAQEISKDIYAKTMFLYNVIAPVTNQLDNGVQWVVPHGKSLNEMKVQPYFIGIKLHKQFVQFYTFNGDIYDPMNCNPVHLTKDQSGKDPKFASTFAQPLPHKCKLHPELVKLLDNMPDLSKEIKETPYDEMKRLVDIKLANYRAIAQGQGSMMPQAVVVPPPQTNPAPTGPVIAPQPNVPGPVQPTTGQPHPDAGVPSTTAPAIETPPAGVVINSTPAPSVTPPSLQAVPQTQEANDLEQLDAFESQLRTNG